MLSNEPENTRSCLLLDNGVTYGRLLLRMIKLRPTTQEEYARRFGIDRDRIRGWLYNNRNEDTFKKLVPMISDVEHWLSSLTEEEFENFADPLIKELKKETSLQEKKS